MKTIQFRTDDLTNIQLIFLKLQVCFHKTLLILDSILEIIDNAENDK